MTVIKMTLRNGKELTHAVNFPEESFADWWNGVISSNKGFVPFDKTESNGFGFINLDYVATVECYSEPEQPAPEQFAPQITEMEPQDAPEEPVELDGE